MYTTYQLTHFIDVFNHGITKDPTITRHLHQKIYSKQDYSVEKNKYLRLDINRIGFTGEPVTG